MRKLRCLGVLQLAAADDRGARALLAQPRRMALLAYLAAATPRGTHRRDRLAGLFWPELDQSHARSALRQALHVIRASLGPEILVANGDEEIGLDFSALHCDVAAFDQAAAVGRWEEALDHFRGPLLDGFFISNAPEFEQWLDGARARLQGIALEGARRLMDRAETAGDLAAAVIWGRRAREVAPHDEVVVGRLVQLLDRLGDRAGALRAYDQFAEWLAREYEVEPAAETQAILRTVRGRELREPGGGPKVTIARTALRKYATPARALSLVRRLLAAASRRRQRLRFAVTGTVLLAAAIAATLYTRARAHPALRDDLVAVVPFEAFAPGLKALVDELGVVLSRDLHGMGPLQAVPPAVVRRAWNRRADLSGAMEVGRRTSARFVVFGQLIASGVDSLRLSATVLDVASRRSLGDISRTDTIARLDRLADSATISTLRLLGQTGALTALRLASVGTRSQPALKEFLWGQYHYRRAAWRSALDSYDRALALDNGYALALWRKGIVTERIEGFDCVWNCLARRYLMRAGALNHQLLPRDSMLLSADSQAAALKESPPPLHGLREYVMVSTYQAAARDFPDDPEVWYKLGEERQRWGSHFAHVPDWQILDPFERAIALDSAFAPVYLSAFRALLIVRGPDAARRAADAFLRHSAADTAAIVMRIVSQLLDPRAAGNPTVARMLDTLSASQLLNAIELIYVWPDSAEMIVKLGRQYFARPVSDGWFTRRGVLGTVLALRGHVREGYRLIDTEDPNLFGELAIAGVVTPDRAGAVFSEWLRRESASCGSALAWWARRADTSALAHCRRQAEAVGKAGANPSDRVRGAHLALAARAYEALARRDSAEALFRFASIPDSLCDRCFDSRLTRARLLMARDRNIEAAAILNAAVPEAEDGLLGVWWVLERGHVNERLGNHDRALAAYRFVADMWRNSDPELQETVTAARDGIKRLGASSATH